ncbi:hypothetical protein [Oceanicoccus sp. KOV_DT_Chl]|uniref:hypothetical protein n=1 Tax=Oceanicoccus sp. KOV_DT_Chl TaxID=1904639 RepID=UPI0011AFC70E|nr:hypothetical protein [Oceanicoccus sp. KOV_DT_Chl]
MLKITTLESTTTDYFPIFRFFSLGILFLLALFYLYQIHLHSNNIPRHDDYSDSLRFMVEYLNATDFSQRLALFFEQHHEHRTVINRSIYTLYYSFFGELNYQHILLIANFFLIVLVLLHGAIFKHPIAMLTGALLILNLAYWGASFWVITAISYFAVTSFALITLILLTRTRPVPFILAMLSGLLCCYSLGNGMLILPLGAILIYLRNGPNRQLAIWLIFSIGTSFLFFRDYHSSEVITTIFYTDGRENQLQLVQSEPVKFIIWFLSLTGSGFSFGIEKIQPLIGLIIVIFAGFLLKREFKQQPVPMLFCLFLLGTIALTAYMRFVLTFMDIDFQNRYSFYSLVLGAFLLSTFINHVNRKGNPALSNPLIIAIFFFAITFNLYSWHWGRPHVEKMLKPIQQNLIYWLEHEDPKRLFVLFAENPHRLLRQAREIKLYDPIKAIPENNLPTRLISSGNCNTLTTSITIQKPEYSILKIDSTMVVKPDTKNISFCVSGTQYQLEYKQLPVYIPTSQL